MSTERETPEDVPNARFVRRVQTGGGHAAYADDQGAGLVATVHLDIWDETGTRTRYLIEPGDALTVAAALADTARKVAEQ